MFRGMRVQDNQRHETRSREGRARRQIIVLSLLLHILVLLFWDAAIRFDLSALLPQASAPPPPAPAAPLVFDLQQPDKPREVIATPDGARALQAPPKAEFLSDKNALARNQEPAPGLPVTGDPFSRGDMASHELPAPPLGQQKQAAAEPARPATAAAQEAAEASRDLDAEARPDGARAPGGKKAPAAPPSPPFRFDLPRVPHQQLEGRAAESGGLSFNTYNWDFAPYMLALKQRIGRNIFPPLAFSMLGMIDGDTMLRFKIYPDGRLADLELLAYNGHRTLMETSRSAITISAPFPALPADFPNPYLEVTAKFSYMIKR